jgi:cell wall-associated protease
LRPKYHQTPVIMKRNLILGFLFYLIIGCQPITTNAQSDRKVIYVTRQVNWQNQDLKKDKKNGVSTDKAYKKLLRGKKSTPVIVAVIDNGVDINHEDLKEVIWTNPKEIPDNGIDDDNNGYIDDIHGWNFLGTGKSGSIIFESKELTREYVRLGKKFGNQNKSSITSTDTSEYHYYEYIKEKYTQKYNSVKRTFEMFKKNYDDWTESDSVIKIFLQKDSYTEDELKSINTSDSTVKKACNILSKLKQKGMEGPISKVYSTMNEEQLKYDYNPDWNPRKAVGDDPDNFKDVKYGNNDVIGSNPFHGTMVSGIIAAKRDNNIGINGVADNVLIMPILVVPDGDERDKDVALAIRYATDNGAKIINMSFGKEFSPNKEEVLEAMEYAAAHNVLLVHAAGNDATSCDTTTFYPSAYQNRTNAVIPSFIQVGASTMDSDERLAAEFSNYGATTVDIFAPGDNIYTTYPKNKYRSNSGTSFSCPVVAGVAALIWSYYPNLTAKQVKEIILASGVSFADKQVFRPNPRRDEIKTELGKLCISGKVINAYNALKLAKKYNK